MAPGLQALPTFNVNWKPTLLGAAVQFAVIIVPMVRLEISPVIVLGGLLGGAVAGVLTGRYGNVMNNGLVAGGLAGTLASFALIAYGSYASWQLGFGLDSLFAAQYGFQGLAFLFILVPFHAAEGALAALLSNAVRVRTLDRLASS